MRLLVVFCLSVGVAEPALALAGGSGDGGCCGVPPERIESARDLVGQLSELPKNDLELRLALGEICTHYDCGVLNEDEARRAIHAHLADNSGWWDRAQKIGLAIIAFSGLALGILNRYRPRA